MTQNAVQNLEMKDYMKEAAEQKMPTPDELRVLPVGELKKIIIKQDMGGRIKGVVEKAELVRLAEQASAGRRVPRGPRGRGGARGGWRMRVWSDLGRSDSWCWRALRRVVRGAGGAEAGESVRDQVRPDLQHCA